MKLRYLILLVNISLCAIILYCTLQLKSLEYHADYLPMVNDRYMSVQQGLTKGVSAATLMSDYDCTILPVSSPDYTSVLYESIDDGDIILDYIQDDRLLGKIIFERNNDSFRNLKDQILRICFVTIGILLLVIDFTILMIYLQILRPFRRLKNFATNLSIGNLDIPLSMQKDNYFGAFTESFDILREELKKARESEYQANRSKKELVASLSHDIKTPVATINALCEILEIKLQSDENIEKIKTIHQKSNMIDHLISNMFHATLSELQILKVTPIEEPSTVLTDILHDMEQIYPIRVQNELPECLILCDKLRLTQVIDNLLTNSAKYAKTPIHISYQETKDHLLLEVRDFGTTVEDLDLPLVCEKFYRGGNAVAQSGSGLGLYLSKQFMEGMGGELRCEKDHGFVVHLALQKA
ncbi:MAG: histidine kinase [Firmicutes bacterium]|nr:histidine kinase [Bacillota bacterium]